MTTKEILKYAIFGIKSEIQNECAWIRTSGINDGKIKYLKALIEQYDEIKEMIEKEEETE